MEDDMARKGKKRNIQVCGVVLADGTEINAGDGDIVSVFANGDNTVTTTDNKANKTILLNADGETAEWASYLPRFN